MTAAIISNRVKPSTSKGTRDLPTTDKHDEIHLWLCDENNQKTLVEYCTRNIKRIQKGERGTERNFRLSSWEITSDAFTRIVSASPETPCYGYNGYLLGVIDNVITFSIVNKINTWQWERNYNKEKYSSRYYAEFDGDTYVCTAITEGEERHSYALVCEYKPAMSNVGQMLAQIRVYKDKLQPKHLDTRKDIMAVVLTNDESTKYDSFLKVQDVEVYHLSPFVSTAT